MSAAWGLVGVSIVLLAVSAFFVAAEFSLISARRTVLEPLAVTSARARVTLRAMEDIAAMMACAQLGITVCGVLLGAVGEPAVARLLEPLFIGVGVGTEALHPVSLVVALVLVVGAHVALGELVPKNVALAGPENAAMLLAPPLRAMATFLRPVVRLLNAFANAVVRLLGREPRNEVASAFTRDEVAGLLTESRSEGLLDPGDHELITSALEFDAATVHGILLPDAQVVSLPVGVTAAEVEQACARTGFSRFPIRDTAGSYLGYLHIRDVLDVPADRRDDAIPTGRIRPLPVVPAGSGLRVALEQMRRRGAHLAQVAAPEPAPAAVDPPDPAGELSALVAAGEQLPAQLREGLITLEDVLEELVGEIRDATTRAQPASFSPAALAARTARDRARSLRRKA